MLELNWLLCAHYLGTRGGEPTQYISYLCCFIITKTKGAAPANWSFYFRTSGDICNQLPALTSHIAEKKGVNPAPHKIILFILYCSEYE